MYSVCFLPLMERGRPAPSLLPPCADFFLLLAPGIPLNRFVAFIADIVQDCGERIINRFAIVPSSRAGNLSAGSTFTSAGDDQNVTIAFSGLSDFAEFLVHFNLLFYICGKHISPYF